MRRLSLVLGLVVASSGCVKHFECEVHKGPGVRELVTEHFVVSSDLPEAELREEGLRLELLWDTFAAYFRFDVAKARIPVVVFEKSAAVQAFAEGYAGYVVRQGTRVLVVGDRAEKGALNTNAHELTHLVSAFMLPRQPHWIAEALATYFEDATFKDARTVTMGRWNKGRAEEAFYRGIVSLADLDRWTGLQFDDGESRLYASAWAYLHYLSNHDEARLQRLFEGLRGTKPLSEVMREVFPPAEAKELEAKVTAYLGEARFRGFETSLRRVPQLSEVKTLAPWQVHLLRSRLFLRDEAASKKDVALAIELAPTPKPPAIAVLEAKASEVPMRSLVSTYPGAPEVLGELDGESGKAMQAEFAKAVELHPDDAQLLLVAANVALENEAYDEAEALAVRGLEQAPWSVELLLVSMTSAAARHHCELAAARFARVESLLGEQLSESTKQRLATLRGLVEKCSAQ